MSANKKALWLVRHLLYQNRKPTNASQMPGLPQNTFEASSDSRASSKTSVLVSLLLNEPAGPKQPTARQFAVEMPVPFGPITLRTLMKVSGTEGGRKVSGSEMKVSTLQVQSKSRLPLNEVPANGGRQTAPNPAAGP